MNKKNIGLLIPNLHGGGAQRVVSNLSLHLPDRFNIYIIVHDSSCIDYSYQGTLLDLAEGHQDNIFGKVKILLSRIIKLRKIKKKYKLDTVVSFMEGPNIVNILSGGKTKNIVSVRNNISDSYQDFYGKVYKILIRLLYPHADRVVVLGKILKDQLAQEYSIPEEIIDIIFNPIDLEKIAKKKKEELPVEYRDSFNHPVVINVGRLNVQKGQDLLLRAFKLVIKQVPDALLFIVGKGEKEKELKKLVSNLGLSGKVIFTGFQENPFQFLARSDIFVFSSLYEGFGNAMVEAMACGLPVISFDCKAGIREILAPESDCRQEANTIDYTDYGVLVPPQNVELLAEAMITVLNNKNLQQRYRKLAAERARDFSLANIIDNWCKILDNI